MKDEQLTAESKQSSTRAMVAVDPQVRDKLKLVAAMIRMSMADTVEMLVNHRYNMLTNNGTVQG